MLEASTVHLDEKSTPLDEVKDFENDDDKKFHIHNLNHEKDVLKIKQGFVGKITGSTDSTANSVLLIGVICAVCALSAMIGMVWQADQYFKALMSFTNIISAIIGYLLGKRN